MINALFTTGFSIAAVEGWLIALVPSITAIAAIIFSLIKIIRSITALKTDYENLKASVNDKTELTAVKAEMNTIIKQNGILRKELEDLITTQGKVKYDGPKE